MSVKQKILREYRAKNSIELQELKSKKKHGKAVKTKKIEGYIHRNRTFRRIIAGLLVYISIMVVFITLIFFYLG